MWCFNIPSVSARGTGCSYHLLASLVCELLDESWAHLTPCTQFVECDWPLLGACALLHLYCIRNKLPPGPTSTSLLPLTHSSHLVAVTLMCGFVSSPLQFWSRGLVSLCVFSDYVVLYLGYNQGEVIIK